MEIMTEARREDKDKVEKAVVLEKDSETQYAEHVDEPASGMGIAAFMTTEPLKDADYGTFDQPMEKKPKLCETDSGKLERKQSFIKLAGKQRVPIEDSTQISKAKSLQLKPESTGEEEDKDTRTQHLGSAKNLAAVVALRQKISNDPAYAAELHARTRRCQNPEYHEAKVLDPEDSTQISKGKSLQLKVESTGEEEDKDTRKQHLGSAKNLAAVEALRLKIANDPAYAAELHARTRRCLNPEYHKAKVLDPEVLRRNRERMLQVRFVPAREGEKEGHIEWFRKDREGRLEFVSKDKEGRSRWFRKDHEGHIELIVPKPLTMDKNGRPEWFWGDLTWAP